ncbi:guanylin-like [Leucoraja erinacea]|uniref:guanylin-like n=1 Tax=Leucoraja erinaceus TaxID=7782 RepID=UPI002458830B|nr:guanylin-like [Leucoraja erinacea]
MKTAFSLIVAISCLSGILTNVMVQDGNYTFPLKDVKQLWTLMNTLPNDDPAVVNGSSHSLCLSSNLPKVFQTVCLSTDAAQVLHRLEKMAVKSDDCEICVHPACTDC